MINGHQQMSCTKKLRPI